MTLTRVLPVALILVAATFSGCVTDAASARNFEVTPNRIGWNVGDEASFNVTLVSTLGRSEPEYTLDPNFAIAEVHLKKRGLGFGGDHRTKHPEQLDLRILVNGEEVEEVRLTAGGPSAELRLRLPEDLHDAAYNLELDLFRVGWVKSEPFRVNVPWSGD